MKRILVVLYTALALFAALTLFAGCGAILILQNEKGDDGDKDGDNKFNPAGATELTVNIWADGEITTVKKEQWFKFTATASRQYIHFNRDTLDVKAELYNSKGSIIVNETSYSPMWDTPFTIGEVYYIKIVSATSSPNTGTYKIGFTMSNTAPTGVKLPSDAIQLTADAWADGNIPTSKDEQWFKFTATETIQFIHIKLTTDSYSSGLYIQLYKSNNGYGETLKDRESLYGNTKYAKQTLTAGQEYYIKVTSYNSYTGTYKIAFNSLPITPGTTITTLTTNDWTVGTFTTDSKENWFSFTATTTTQYIHADSSTLSGSFGVDIQLYDNSGTKVGSSTNLDGSTKYTPRTVSVGQTYYIRVTPYNSFYTGTYKIGFTTSSTAPTS